MAHAPSGDTSHATCQTGRMRPVTRPRMRGLSRRRLRRLDNISFYKACGGPSSRADVPGQSEGSATREAPAGHR
jgi:hypothetical protein